MPSASTRCCGRPPPHSQTTVYPYSYIVQTTSPSLPQKLHGSVPLPYGSGTDTIHTQRQGLQQQHLQQQQANTTALPRDKSWSPTCHPLHNRAIEPPAIEPHSLSTGIVGIPPAGTADQPPRGWGGRGLSASPPHNLPRVCYTHAPGRATWQKR